MVFPQRAFHTDAGRCTYMPYARVMNYSIRLLAATSVPGNTQLARMAALRSKRHRALGGQRKGPSDWGRRVIGSI